MTWTAFEAVVEPLAWGRNTYTILRLPPEVDADLGRPKRVEGEIADHPVNLAPAKAPVLADRFVYVGKAMLAAIGIEPGEVVEIRLRPADPDAVEVPADVMAAVRAAGLVAGWEALTPGKRRGLLVPVAGAKRAETRAKRIAALVAELR